MLSYKEEGMFKHEIKKAGSICERKGLATLDDDSSRVDSITS